MSLKPAQELPDPARTEVDQTAPDPEFIRLTEEIDSLQSDLAAKVKRRMAIEIWIGIGVIFLFKGGSAGIMATFFTQQQEPLIPFVVCLAAIGCALHISGKFSLFGFSSKHYMPDKSKEKEIEQQIEDKRIQLAKHIESVP